MGLLRAAVMVDIDSFHLMLSPRRVDSRFIFTHNTPSTDLLIYDSRKIQGP